MSLDGRDRGVDDLLHAELSELRRGAPRIAVDAVVLAGFSGERALGRRAAGAQGLVMVICDFVFWVLS